MPSRPTTADLRRWLSEVGELAPARDDADRIDRLRLLEELKSAVAAAQVLEATEFDRSQRTTQARGGVPAAQQGRGVAAQVALALRVSPWRAQRWLGWARILTAELPATFAVLRGGRTTEWRAMLVARETAPLAREGRAEVDAALAPLLAGWGDRRVEAEARRAVYRIDPAGAVERTRRAEADRRVTIRPAPDTMCRLTALLPVAQGVATYAALSRAADTTTAAGDHRGRGQIMADTLVERLTGQEQAHAVPVEVVLLMTDESLLGADANPGLNGGEPASLLGREGSFATTVPAGIARELALGRPGDSAPRWLRRMYAAPDGGRLVAMESRRREFTGPQRQFLRLRDQTCRTPWCDAPIRHTDHVRPYARGGSTSVANGQGLCEACNYAKQAPGWSAHPARAGTTVVTRTPTGHQYVGLAPDPPGVGAARSPVERRVLSLLLAA